jgi:uroporphyrinogen III methyltransferase/synthase
LGGVRIAAIGRATAAELALYGIHADVEAAEANSEGLERALMIELRNAQAQRLVFCAAEGGRDYEWPAMLAAGHYIERIFAYQTVPVKTPALAEAAQAADLWTFASGSAVKGLLTALPDAVASSRTKRIVSLGPVTTQVLEQCGFIVAATALAPTLAGILDALREAVGTSEPAVAAV